MSQITSMLSSVLMSLPLIAVPCLAIFGLPTSESQSETTEDAGIELGVPSGLGDATVHAHGEHTDESPFTSFEDGDFASRTTNPEHVSANTLEGRSQIATTSGHLGAAANAAVGLDEHTAESESHHGHDHDHAEADSEPLNLNENPFLGEMDRDGTGAKMCASEKSSASDSELEAVVEHLRRMGVKQSRLADSEIDGQFFFCCSVPTSRNIVQRFEAEAGSPAAAARDVLAQVESWQSTR